MKLSIITPQFNETEEIVKPLLSSIENQVGFNLEDLEVVVINDGSDVKLADNFLKSFNKLNIEYLVNENNGGSSIARNIGLEKATGDYIMFCDADDRFLSATALFQIASAVQKDQVENRAIDFYNCDFIEESLVDGMFRYIKHTENFIFLHGKVYRKEFLDENKITFCGALTKNEDVHFNALCRSLAKSIRIIPNPIYLWCYNPLSLSRELDSFFSRYSMLIKSSHKIAEDLLSRNNKRAALYAVQFHYYTYFQMQRLEWLEPKRLEYKRIAEDEFYRYHMDYKDLFAQVPEQVSASLYEQERLSVLGESNCSTTETYRQFLDRIEKK